MRKNSESKREYKNRKRFIQKPGDEKALYFMDLFCFLKFFILFLETGTELAV